MTEPSQYFKGRTVQEQMDEVIGYVDKRAEEVAAAKADAVLQPAEQAKTAAQAAAEAAEAAKDTTLAALPEIRQDISGLKAEDVALDGRLDTVELKVQTAEGNIVTIQGQIVALQTADGQNVKITGNQNIDGVKTFTSSPAVPAVATGTFDSKAANGTKLKNELDNYAPMIRNTGNQTINGIKVFQSQLLGNTVNLKTVDFDVTAPGSSTKYTNAILWVDQNDQPICKIWVSQSANGQIKLGCDIKNSDNSWKFGQILVTGDVI